MFFFIIINSDSVLKATDNIPLAAEENDYTVLNFIKLSKRFSGSV